MVTLPQLTVVGRLRINKDPRDDIIVLSVPGTDITVSRQRRLWGLSARDRIDQTDTVAWLHRHGLDRGDRASDLVVFATRRETLRAYAAAAAVEPPPPPLLAPVKLRRVRAGEHAVPATNVKVTLNAGARPDRRWKITGWNADDIAPNTFPTLSSCAEMIARWEAHAQRAGRPSIYDIPHAEETPR